MQKQSKVSQKAFLFDEGGKQLFLLILISTAFSIWATKILLLGFHNLDPWSFVQLCSSSPPTVPQHNTPISSNTSIFSTISPRNRYPILEDHFSQLKIGVKPKSSFTIPSWTTSYMLPTHSSVNEQIRKHIYITYTTGNFLHKKLIWVFPLVLKCRMQGTMEEAF